MDRNRQSTPALESPAPPSKRDVPDPATPTVAGRFQDRAGLREKCPSQPTSHSDSLRVRGNNAPEKDPAVGKLRPRRGPKADRAGHSAPSHRKQIDRGSGTRIASRESPESIMLALSFGGADPRSCLASPRKMKPPPPSATPPRNAARQGRFHGQRARP